MASQMMGRSCTLTPEDKSTISKWIGTDRLSFISLYKASAEGGCYPATFHYKCDYKGATITVAYNTTGYVFGAYTSQSFASQNRLVPDSQAFLFRLREAGKVAYCKLSGNNNPALLLNPSYGPSFGNWNYGEEFRFFAFDNPLRDGIITSNSLSANLSNQAFNTAGVSWSTFGGDNCNLLELEVYKVEGRCNGAFKETLQWIDHSSKIVWVYQENQPWRKNNAEWTENERDMLKEKIAYYKPVSAINVQVPNILLIGQVGAGKSSFFNTINSVFQGYVTGQAVAGSSTHSLTTRYRTYQPRLKPGGELMNFRLCDTMGLEEDAGIDISDISHIINGSVQDKYQVFEFNPGEGLRDDDPNLKKDVKLKDKIHVAAFVVEGSTIEVMSAVVRHKITQIKKQMNKYAIPSVAILTKIDKVCPNVAEDVSNVFHSPSVSDCVDQVSEKLGIPRSHVLPVKNYENEADVDTAIDVLALRALLQLLHLADNFFDEQIDMLCIPPKKIRLSKDTKIEDLTISI